MVRKIVSLSVIFILFFIIGFSQNANQSEHPLLDKYYPSLTKKPDTTAAKPFAPVVQTKTAPALTNLPAPTTLPAATTTVTSLPKTPVATPQPIVSTEPPVVITPAEKSVPVANSAPSISATNSITNTPNEKPTLLPQPEVTLPETTTPQTTTATALTNMPASTNLAATTTPVVNRASAVISQIVPAKVQTQAPSTPYMDTRLGSSSPLYDTWEKNNNGAGSVTTSPK